MFKQVLIFIFIGISSLLFAQKKDLKFEGFSIQEGLSSNTVNDIIRDCDGFIWVATEDGLNRYDGQSFKTYRSSETDTLTLTSNMIFVMLDDYCHNFLVGASNGLSLYNPNFDRFERLLEGVEVRDIIEYSKGGYMLATDKGLIQLDTNFAVVESYHPSENEDFSSLTCVFEDSQNRLWMGNYQHGMYLMIAPNVFENFSTQNGKAVGDFCKDIIEDHKHRVLVSTYDNGISYYNSQLGRFVALPVKNNTETLKKATTIYEDEDLQLWVGTAGGGLTLYNEATQKYISYTHDRESYRSITDNVVTVVYSDKRGGLWIGTHHRGVNFVNKYSTNFTHKEHFPTYEGNNIIACFKEDKQNNLWIGTDGGGVLRYSSKMDKVDLFKKTDSDSSSISNNNVMAIETDKQENVWLGSYNGGIDVYNPKTKKFKHYNKESGNNHSLAGDIVWKLHKDSKGRMWACTRHGLSLYRPKTNDFISFTAHNTNLKDENIRDILEIDSTHFYVATAGGFSVFDLQRQSFKTFVHHKDDPTSISNSFVLTIEKDNLNRIWLGTYGGGINLFNPKTETFTYWTKENGLSNNYISGIIPTADSTLWITTQQGLSLFNPRTHTFQNYYFKDGLQDDKFSIGATLQLQNGELLLGGINGYNSFRPKNIRANMFAPMLQFTDLKVFNKHIDFTKEDAVIKKHISHLTYIELPYDKNTVGFYFSALNFIQSEKNKVIYYLEGFDKEWSEPIHIDRANYTNLSPGDYIFHVKAENNHGVWNDKELNIKLTITPPYWETIWFRSLVLTVLGLLFYSFYKARIKIEQYQRKLLEEKVDQRTMVINKKNDELQERERRRVQSLNYAKLIQNAILPSIPCVEKEVKELFVLLQPSEIVSGDFYWMNVIDGNTVICAVDCTGHGVPGAFMSMMGNTLLNRIIKIEKTFAPDQILERLHEEVVRSLHQKETRNADGMDVSVIVINKEKTSMCFAGAMNPLVYFQDGRMSVIKGTRRNVGGVEQMRETPFINHSIDITKKTTFYLFSDGYPDQFGENGKKYMIKRFKELLDYVHLRPMKEQHQLLEKEHFDWRNGKTEQTDDILVIGCKVS